jgi:hypothetical protein
MVGPEIALFVGGGCCCFIFIIAALAAAAWYFFFRTKDEDGAANVEAQSVSGLENVQGKEHIKVVGTGEGSKVLQSSGEADLVEDDGRKVWVAPRINTRVSPDQWSDDWGPVSPEQFSEFAYHFCEVEDAMGLNIDGVLEMAKGFGYADMGQYFKVKTTFLKKFGEARGPTLDAYAFGADFNTLMLQARGRQQQAKMAATAAANPDMFAPIDGVSLDTYAALTANAASGIDQAQFLALLAQHGLDHPTWESANAGWTAKMSQDTTGTIASAMAKAMTGAGAGQFGSAGVSAADAMGAMGGMGGEAGGEAPVPFEKLCEIQGAQAAWAESGQDINAMLKEVFDMTAMDWSNISAWWWSKMMADPAMMQRYTDLSEDFQRKYAAGGGSNLDDDISF